jgi:uncharacterized protein YebE (UPF0316 family)
MPDLMLLFDQHPLWLPVFIFVARIMDVSIGTFRTICVVRGQRALAASAGFFEVSIWLTAISSAVRHMEWPLVIAYAGGFATGNWVGVWIESKVALGLQVVQIISRQESRMAQLLREAGYVVTEVHGEGRDSPVSISLVTAYRRQVSDLIAKAEEIDSCMLSTVEDVRATNFLPRHYVPDKASGLRSVLKKK